MWVHVPKCKATSSMFAICVANTARQPAGIYFVAPRSPCCMARSRLRRLDSHTRSRVMAPGLLLPKPRESLLCGLHVHAELGGALRLSCRGRLQFGLSILFR